jgi:Domain of unknown function (DUF1841)
MFQPSQHDVRRFFCEVYRKNMCGEPLVSAEVLASKWIVQHPEYHTDLADLDQALAAVYAVDEVRTNPFLHLSMHVAIEEQLSIDQPRGVVAVFQQLAHRHSSVHQAHHEVMECLGDMIWASQRSGLPPDGQRYLACLCRRLG